MKKIIFILFFIGAIAIVGLLFSDSSLSARIQFLLSDNKRKTELIEKWRNYVSDIARKGQSKETILKRIGPSHNLDNKHIWIWIDDYEQVARKVGTTNWVAMSSCGNDGFFILFRDDKVASPIMAFSAIDAKAKYLEIVGATPDAK